MRTVSAGGHVAHVVSDLCEQQGIPTLTEAQLDVVRAAVDRVYGIPLDLPTASDIEAMKADLERQHDRP